MNKLIILTLSWNGKEKLKKLYYSFLPTLKDIDYHWFIRDNGSKDETQAEIASWKNSNITCVPWHNNLQNYSQGNNQLFLQANPNDNDYILLLNNDIVFQDTTSIKKMIGIMSDNQEVGVVGAKLNYEDRPDIIQHAGVLYHPSNIGTPFHYRAGKPQEERDCKNREYPMATGAVLLTQASLWRKIDGLNENLNWSWDDSFYCMEIREVGKKVIYCGETNILHSESATLKQNPINKLFFHQNLKIFMERWGSKIDKSLVEKYSKDPSFALYR